VRNGDEIFDIKNSYASLVLRWIGTRYGGVGRANIYRIESPALGTDRDLLSEALRDSLQDTFTRFASLDRDLFSGLLITKLGEAADYLDWALYDELTDTIVRESGRVMITGRRDGQQPLLKNLYNLDYADHCGTVMAAHRVEVPSMPEFSLPGLVTRSTEPRRVPCCIWLSRKALLEAVRHPPIHQHMSQPPIFKHRSQRPGTPQCPQSSILETWNR
jgi:hypothetical protein